MARVSEPEEGPGGGHSEFSDIIKSRSGMSMMLPVLGSAPIYSVLVMPHLVYLVQFWGRWYRRDVNILE